MSYVCLWILQLEHEFLESKYCLFMVVPSMIYRPGVPEAKQFPRTWDFSAKTRTVPGIPGQLVTLTVSQPKSNAQDAAGAQ